MIKGDRVQKERKNVSEKSQASISQINNSIKSSPDDENRNEFLNKFKLNDTGISPQNEMLANIIRK